MILCSGNPNKVSIAQAMSEIYPDTCFMCRSTGYDVTSVHGLEFFLKNITEHSVFINSSYIAPGVQLNLLDMACKAWMEHDIKGHVISIGTTEEWNPDTQHQEYKQSKTQLRLRSLELNEQTGITGVKTTYIILGGLDTGNQDSIGYPTTASVAQAIDWVLKYPNRVPLLQIESPK